MGQTNSSASDTEKSEKSMTVAAGDDAPKIGKSGKKICCSCPETKKARDACILAHGEDDSECQKLIEAHKECLRGEGFVIQ